LHFDYGIRNDLLQAPIIDATTETLASAKELLTQAENENAEDIARLNIPPAPECTGSTHTITTDADTDFPQRLDALFNFMARNQCRNDNTYATATSMNETGTTTPPIITSTAVTTSVSSSPPCANPGCSKQGFNLLYPCSLRRRHSCDNTTYCTATCRNADSIRHILLHHQRPRCDNPNCDLQGARARTTPCTSCDLRKYCSTACRDTDKSSHMLLKHQIN
jgi:hypothetical protein